jgi:hypothetical protein
VNKFFWLGLRNWLLCSFLLDPSNSLLAAFYAACRDAKMTPAEAAEMWDFNRRTDGAAWALLRDPPLTRSGVHGVMTLVRSPIDIGYLTGGRIDVYSSHMANSRSLGFLDVTNLSRAGVPPEYARSLMEVRKVYDIIIQFHQAGIPAEYVKAAPYAPFEALQDAWERDIPAEYLTAMLG